MQRPPLTAEHILGLYRWGLDQPQERGLRMFIREIRTLFDMQHRVQIPKEYRAIAREVRTPLLRDVALRITASLTKEPPIMRVEPKGDTDDVEKAASIGGRWLQAQIGEMKRVSGEDAIYLSALELVRDSESVIKAVHRPDAWANFPERGAGEGPRQYGRRAEQYRKGSVYGPFAWRAVDRMQMLFGDGEYGDEWAMEYGEYSVPYLDRRYLTTQNPNDLENPTPAMTLAGPPIPEGVGGRASKTIKIEFFDADDWAVVINGRMAPGFPRPNPYAPCLPYARAVSFPTLYPLRWLVPALDACLTMKMNWAYLSAFPVVVMEALASVQQMMDTLPPGDTGEAPTEALTWRPGKVYFPPAGYSMKFLEPPQTGRDLDVVIGELREMIDVAGIPSVFRGVGGSRQAGYAVNQLYAAAQMTYRKLVEALQMQQENIARLLFTSVRSTIGQTVYVLGNTGDQREWLGLKPTGSIQAEVAPVDLLGPPVCTFRPVLPTDEQAMAMIALQAINAPRPLISHEDALTRWMQVEDPQGMIDEIWAERTLDSEPLNSQVIAQAMRDAGLPMPQPAAPPVLPPGGSGLLQPNDAGNAGEPTVPGLTQLIRPTETNPPGIAPGAGGRPAGVFPGQP